MLALQPPVVQAIGVLWSVEGGGAGAEWRVVLDLIGNGVGAWEV